MAPQSAAFNECTLLIRQDGGVNAAAASPTEISRWAAAMDSEIGARVDAVLAGIAAPRPEIPGLSSRPFPLIMGILNVTPDSFSDGGKYLTPDRAVVRGLWLADAGADIIDVGGESTRPGADSISGDEERKRILPVIRTLAEKGVTVSVDTRRAATMRAALDAGAVIINDISALTFDPDSCRVAAESQVPIILMHSPDTHGSTPLNPHYDDVVLDTYDYLEARLAACKAEGIGRDRLIVDPGIGFGKTTADNVAILRELAIFQGFGRPILLGASRKRFIASFGAGESPDDRLAGSLAVALHGLNHGVQILRVHDVRETVQACAAWKAMTA